MRSHHRRRWVLRTTAGLAAAVTGLGAVTGAAAAHFPEEFDVDVKPGTEQNPSTRGATG